jgi:hypothetical protein
LETNEEEGHQSGVASEAVDETTAVSITARHVTAVNRSC